MEENDNMSNYGGVGASDAAVLALLADTSRAGRGGGYGGGYGEGGGYGGYGPFGGPSSNAVRIDRNNDSTIRNGQDAHFFELSSQSRSDFNLLNLQQQNNALANQQQISQLALQLCQCCGDQKAAIGAIQGKLDCMGKDIALDVALLIEKQTNQDLLGQVAVAQNAANGQASSDQHGQILQALGQIAGLLATMQQNGNGNGNGPPWGRGANGVAT